jgi:hypothetical protein
MDAAVVRHANALSDACGRSCWERTPPEVAQLIMVHLYGMDGAKANQYHAGESCVITAAQIEQLPEEVRALVTATLWLADFKWLSIDDGGEGGDGDGGAATRVHFGRELRYGGRAPTVTELGAFRLSGSRLHFNDGRKAAFRDVAHIEVPSSADKYIFVMPRS